MLTVVVLCAVAAAVGFWLGQSPRAVSETDAINGAAARYVADTGGDPSDCVAIPGEGAVWIIVNCGSASSVAQYYLDRSGQLMRPPGPST